MALPWSFDKSLERHARLCFTRESQLPRMCYRGVIITQGCIHRGVGFEFKYLSENLKKTWNLYMCMQCTVCRYWTDTYEYRLYVGTLVCLLLLLHLFCFKMRFYLFLISQNGLGYGILHPWRWPRSRSPSQAATCMKLIKCELSSGTVRYVFSWGMRNAGSGFL